MPLTSPRWLLLAHQLPTRPSHWRVKTWRRLQHIGAVPTRNSVYVLPNAPQCREDFEWIRSEIVAAGGEATVFAADSFNPDGDEAIVKAFRAVREADYAAFARDAERLLARKRRIAGPGREALSRAVRTLSERLSEIERIDFCNAPGRQTAAGGLAALERRLMEQTRVTVRAGTSPPPAVDFHHRRWVTRPRPGVDRMASAWLIRRFIDSRATFAFVEEPAATDVPFDMYAGAFSHRGSHCTFEVLAERFALRQAAVARIAEIVHDLDMKESTYGAPEGAAVSRMVEGLRHMHPDDHVLLEQGIAMFEALAHSFESSVAHESRRSGRRPKPSKPKRPHR